MCLNWVSLEHSSSCQRIAFEFRIWSCKRVEISRLWPCFYCFVCGCTIVIVFLVCIFLIWPLRITIWNHIFRNNGELSSISGCFQVFFLCLILQVFAFLLILFTFLNLLIKLFEHFLHISLYFVQVFNVAFIFWKVFLVCQSHLAFLFALLFLHVFFKHFFLFSILFLQFFMDLLQVFNLIL